MKNRQDIEKLIESHLRRLQKLKEQKALYGISVDPRILIEIENIEVEIERLQKDLESTKSFQTPSEHTRPKEKLNKAAIVFCKHCGSTAGQPGSCINIFGHEFVQVRPGYEIIYCKHCGVTIGKRSHCISFLGHKFVAASPGCAIVFCKHCGTSVGERKNCVSLLGHEFIEGNRSE